MTHIAWVPPDWVDAAERTLEGMGERHPSRTVILIPHPDEPDGIDAQLWVRSLPGRRPRRLRRGDRALLRGNRTQAPASIVLPLLISDLPVYLRWRGEPPFDSAQWQQLAEVADRVVIDSSEWRELRYRELAVFFDITAVSDIAWARTDSWRIALASHWPAIAEQEIAIRGPRAEAALLRGWLASRLERDARPGRARRGADRLAGRRGASAAPQRAALPKRPSERRARQARARPDLRSRRPLCLGSGRG